jgi:hypothetical protein
MTRSPLPGAPLTGTALVTGLNTRFKQLYDAAAFPLTSIGGTANAVTATLVPALDGSGLLDGMGFTLTWAAANTGGVTLAINGGSALPVLNADGSALTAGAVGAGLRSVLSYIGGNFVVVSPTLLMGASNGNARYSWVFTASGTWTKPDGLSGDTPVTIEAVGAGGGGGSAAGGGGGAYAVRVIRLSDLTTSVTLTVGEGGVGGVLNGAAGGNTTFGGFLTAYGGGPGLNLGRGGRGGGELQAGGTLAAGGRVGGGVGGNSTAGGDAATVYGGGGGGGEESSTPRNGGWAVHGAGGGGALATALGGLSAYAGAGGAGGAPGSAGVAPGGGGGNEASGARGEVRVWI